MRPTRKGVGPVVKHGFPPPPPLTRGQTQDKTDAQLFEVVTQRHQHHAAVCACNCRSTIGGR